MSERAEIDRTMRRLWAASGSRHDRVVRILRYGLPLVIGVVAAVRAGAGAGPAVLDDPRCTVAVGDVRDVVAAQPDACLDAVLLDVDNGPDFLVHETNAAVYAADGLADAARVLRPGGTLAVWSMADSAPLRARLAALLDDVRAVAVPVDLQGRSEHYWVLTGRAR